MSLKDMGEEIVVSTSSFSELQGAVFENLKRALSWPNELKLERERTKFWKSAIEWAECSTAWKSL